MKNCLFQARKFKTVKTIISLIMVLVFPSTTSLGYANNHFSRNMKTKKVSGKQPGQRNTSAKTNSDKTISVTYTFDAPELTPQKDDYYRITMPATETESEVGKPEIPVSYVKILLPFATDLDSYVVTPKEKITLPGMYKISYGKKPIPMLPEQELIDKGFNLSLAQPDQDIYSSASKYPAQISTPVLKQVDRGYTFTTMNLHPVEYIPATGEISYYKSITVKLTTKPSTIKYSYRAKEKDKDLVLDAYLSNISHAANARKTDKSTQAIDKATALQALSDIQKEIKPNILESYPTDFQSISSSMSKGEVYPDGRSLSGAGAAVPMGGGPLLNPLTETCEYLIITSDALKDSFQVLADHKSTRPINPISACVVTVEDIYANQDYSCTGPYNWGDTCGSNNQFNDNPAKIRNYIRYAYQELGTKYVLLGGDADRSTITSGETEPPIVPVRYLGNFGIQNYYYDNVNGVYVYWYTETIEIPSDLYYSNLDNSFDDNEDGTFFGLFSFDTLNGSTSATLDPNLDLESEVFVGRASVDSVTEANNFVQKTILAETNNDRIDPLMVGEYLGHYGSNYRYATEDLEEIKNGGTYHGYATVGFTSTYSDSEVGTLYDEATGGYPSNTPPAYLWSKNVLTGQMNDGITLINHFGHANNTYVMKLSLNNVSSLNNPEPMFIYSQGCYSGAFDNWAPGDSSHNQGYLIANDAIVERFTTIPSQKGAFASVMNSRYGWFSSVSTNGPSQHFARWFWDGAFNNESGLEEKTLGRLNSYSHEKNIFRAGTFMGSFIFTETNLLGDPEYQFNFSDEPINTPPTADAGSNQTVDEGTLVQLNGSGSSDPQDDDLTYLWTAPAG
ncbi:MAG: C25 family cysteine peptidase, partial [Candidatus Omnitrophica bacterium]|nr:C25 family cysteine peptidase [Candidatus Omnitrophota bacterium]